MKVLILAPPLAGAGGIQRYTLTLVRALRDLLGDESVRVLAIPKAPDGNGVRRLPARSKLGFGFDAVREAVGWRPNLVICTHLALGPLGWLAKTCGGPRYWTVVHGIESWGQLPAWKRAALRRADRVIVTSAFSREQVVKRHQIDAKRLSSLPCTLDETLLNTVPAEAGAGARIPGTERVVLTVARMSAGEQYKGHDVVLRAMPSVLARIPNLTYVMVGGGDDRPRLERMTQELGLAGHVVFTGEVSDSELVALYRRSEVFVLPARTVMDEHNPKGEGFGIVYLEAMAFGKPVIGPHDGAPAELIRDGEFGLLVDPESPAAVADALFRLLNSPQEARTMGESASRWVREHYSFRSLCRRVKELLAESGYLGGNRPEHVGVAASTGGRRGGSAGDHS
jgi:glycosyltransferase involved in cell wall biosynthesis